MLVEKQGEAHKAATKEEHEKQYHRGTKILIIDDDPDITLVFRRDLTDKGFEEVETANDPILALKNFKKGSYGSVDYRHYNATNGWFQTIRKNQKNRQ